MSETKPPITFNEYAMELARIFVDPKLLPMFSKQLHRAENKIKEELDRASSG